MFSSIKEVNRLISKGMSNTYCQKCQIVKNEMSKIYYWEKLTFSKEV